MSWFESTSIASLAKSAIKEAQKTIDKALDINEGASATSPATVNDAPITSNLLPKQVATAKMVGSLWGSFSESFFDNQNSTSNDKAASASTSTSAPVTPSGVVATQPPRLSDARLPDASDVSSSSSSIVAISSSGEVTSPPSLEPLNEEISRSYGGGGWEWGWESSIVLPSDSNSQDSSVRKLDSQTLEESLADDAIDPEGFSRSRLIVSSVDSESRSSINSSKSVIEDQNLQSVCEEVFCELPSSSSLVRDSSQPPPEEQEEESQNSIITLDSQSVSPRDAVASLEDVPDLSLNSSESIEVLSNSNSIASPSSNSIEVLSPSSTDSFYTLDDSSTSEGRSNEPPTLTSFKSLPSIEEKTWSEDAESSSGTITRQPQAARLRHQETQEGLDDLESSDSTTPIHSSFISAISEEGSTSESVHSASTSSTLTIVDTTSVPENCPLDIHEISEREPPPEEKFESLEPSSVVSMNAGEIRKNLDKVKGGTEHLDKVKGESLKAVIDVSSREIEGETEFPRREEYEFPPLEMSSRSESSTDTITTSMDIQQNMTWSDMAPLDICPEESAVIEESEKPLEDLLEEAISDDKTKGSDGSPPFDRELSPSSSDRSDVLKVTSSGHSSADEVETTTSSDIEVISSPSIDGSNNGASRSFSVPPSVASKVWMTAQKGLRSFLVDKAESHRREHSTHDRGETIPSSMTTSFTSISESEGDLAQTELLQLEASRITQVLLQDINLYGKGHRRNQSNLSETSESSSEQQTPETEKLWKKINKLTDILESRETKVLELSHSNVSLNEANQSLKSRVEELECLKMGSEATESVREEFTQRLVTMERKFQQALREKESTKRQLEEYRTEVASRRSNSDIVKELAEKEMIINELRHEGEKLSKQQLNYSTITKKLRTKEKEAETCIKDQKDKIESMTNEMDRLRKQLDAKEEVERRQIEAIRQYTVTLQRQDIQLKDLAAENAEVEGKMATLKEALDSGYREIAELQRVAATRDAEAQEQALSAEVATRQRLEETLKNVHKEHKMEKETLLAQILELKDDLNRNENQANRKERHLKAEISDLHQRLTDAECRTDEISSSVMAATRPLMRQMEHLQASHATQQATWDALEESLTRRLNEAQNQQAISAKKEREAKEQQAAVLSNLSTLESQVSTLQSERASLKSKLDTLIFKCTSVEEEKAKETTQLEALKSSFAEEISDVKRERDIFEQQLDIERLALASEKKKIASLGEQIREKDKRVAQLQSVAASSNHSSPRSSPTPSLTRLSVSGSMNDSFSGSHWGNDDVFDAAWMKGSSVYDSLRGNNAATVEILSSSLRQREGELHHLQTEMSRLEAQKESLAQELVHASRTTDELDTIVNQLHHMKQSYKDMEQKYNALLQMYGEKVEEVDELRLDLADVKEMYKLQIDQLLQK